MSRNTHQKRHKKNSGEQTKELIVKEEGQEYATVTKVLGNSRFEVACFDSVNRLAHVRGTMRKSQWVNSGDLILISLRDYQDNKCDIIHVYTAEEGRRLKQKGELPEAAEIDKDDDSELAAFDFAEL